MQTENIEIETEILEANGKETTPNKAQSPRITTRGRVMRL